MSKLESFDYHNPPPAGEYQGDVNEEKLVANGFEYNGQLDQLRKKNGRGVQLWPDGSLYFGYWSNDKANGRGRRIYPNGEIYEGEWKEDKRHGKGKLIYEDGSTYEGDWSEDIQDGKGKETKPNGS